MWGPLADLSDARVQPVPLYSPIHPPAQCPCPPSRGTMVKEASDSPRSGWRGPPPAGPAQQLPTCGSRVQEPSTSHPLASSCRQGSSAVLSSPLLPMVLKVDSGMEAQSREGTAPTQCWDWDPVSCHQALLDEDTGSWLRMLDGGVPQGWWCAPGAHTGPQAQHTQHYAISVRTHLLRLVHTLFTLRGTP